MCVAAGPLYILDSVYDYKIVPHSFVKMYKMYLLCELHIHTYIHKKLKNQIEYFIGIPLVMTSEMMQ